MCHSNVLYIIGVIIKQNIFWKFCGFGILSPCDKEQLFAQIWVCKLDNADNGFKGLQKFQSHKKLELVVRFYPKIFGIYAQCSTNQASGSLQDLSADSSWHD